MTAAGLVAVNLGHDRQTSMCWTFPERGQLSDIERLPLPAHESGTVYRPQSVPVAG